MVRYRRSRVPGGTYFFTVTLRDRSSTLLVDRIGVLGDALARVLRDTPFRVEAMVVLPDHLHALWTLPPGDADYPRRIARLKALFTHGLAAAGAELPRAPRGGYRVWQARYWEHTIRDSEDFARHMDYIHWNPVKHGQVARTADWPYSSFHRLVRTGVYPQDWAVSEPIGGAFGE